jgi:predicted transcriptional regulator
MQIILHAKHNKEKTFTQVSNELIYDFDLDWEAKGFMDYLLSKTDDFSINIPNIENETRCDRNKIYRILRKLIKAGYIYRDIERRRNEDGTFSTTSYYLVFEDKTHRQESINRLRTEINDKRI